MRSILFSLLAGLLSQLATAQTASDTVYTSRLSDAFQQYAMTFPEKVYLHTDKPYYYSGDTIWIKGYQVDAVSHTPSKGSRYLYVDLVNRKNKIVNQLKLEKEEGSYLGYMPLSKEIEDGDYYLRAYTHWMRNWDADYFFSRNLRIITSQSPFMHPEIRYEQEGNERKAIITFRKSDGSLYVNHWVEYMIRTTETGNHFRQQKTSTQGEIRITIPPKEKLEQYLYLILEDVMQKHKYTFYIPDEFDYQVDFFPEGGELIANTTQKIAFKALDTQGNTVDIQGSIVNQQGDTLTHFESIHNGIGNFIIATQEKEKYTAIVHTPQGKTRLFELPQPQKDNYAISVNRRNNLLYYNILHADNKFVPQSFYLVGHTRGRLLFVNPLEADNGVIHVPGLPEGILTLLLLDKNYVPYSERLILIRQESGKWMVEPDKAVYAPRSAVSVDIQLTDKEGRVLNGDFSLSVTDNHSVVTDSLDMNILSYLLASSDLKGHIASPGYYFRDDSPRMLACLDDLMLTHGWSRFDVPALMQMKHKEPEFFMEIGQTISGKVLNGVNKPHANVQVNIFINATSPIPIFTDKKGLFLMDKLKFSGTTRVEAYLQDKPRFVRSIVKIDKDDYPPTGNRVPYKQLYLQENQQAYVDSIQSPFQWVDGVWQKRLPEITVSADAIIKDRFSSYKLDDEEKVAQKKARTAMDLVKAIPGLSIIDNRPYLTEYYKRTADLNRNDDPHAIVRPLVNGRKGRPAVIKLNNRYIPFNYLSQISADDISEVYKIEPEVNQAFTLIDRARMEKDYLDAITNGATVEELEQMEEALYGPDQARELMDGSAGTKNGGEIILVSPADKHVFVSNDSRYDQVFLKGIDLYKEFYVPRYEPMTKENFSQPDNRTTIHWQPRLIFDENGKAQVRFYTSDNPVSYTITIEGIAENGSPFYYQQLLNP